jgi:adenylate cyclase
MGRSQRRSLLLLGVAVSAVCCGLAVSATSALNRLELDSIDARFSVRGAETPPPQLAIVSIDDASFDHLPRWQDWSRRLHADVIRRLHAAGAKVIAYDVQFTEPSKDLSADLDLYRAAGEARPVVFATTITAPDGSTNVLGGDANLRRIGAVAGQALLPNDPGGVIRRLPFQVRGLRGFAIQTVGAWAGTPVRRSSLPDRTPTIDYAGPPGTIPSVPFWRVRAGRFDPALFRGRIVVVGPSAPSLQDVHPTSTTGEDLMSGAEIQANAISTVIRDFPLRPVAAWINILLVTLMAVVAPLILLRLRPGSVNLLLAAIVSFLLIAAVFLVNVQVAFNSGRIVEVTGPLTALIVGGSGALLVGYVTETRERRHVRQLFGRFVPAAVVDQVVERTDDDLRLGGSRLDSTVMFADLRGFTSYAEPLDPHQVISALNTYLTEMSDAILDHGGTLVAYMGDGIMAVFGAPLEQEDHADRALAAAREMLGERLTRFNAWVAQQGAAPFRMGIGLNSGPVMSGNVGSTRRLEYTAVGDTTNTAARLESMTKDTPFQLLLSEATRERLTAPPGELEEVGEMDVRGREGSLLVWGLVASRAPAPPAEVPES